MFLFCFCVALFCFVFFFFFFFGKSDVHYFIFVDLFNSFGRKRTGEVSKKTETEEEKLIKKEKHSLQT